MFKPFKQSALSALEAFIPKAGAHYAANRNIDTGTDHPQHVSQLSPWVRTRLLPEWMLVARVLEHHGRAAASKFIDEVCWRTYWKGWLYLRPKIWDDYQNELKRQLDEWGDHARYSATIRGQSGFECMDAWTNDLIQTGYLHNHARMWYASIWIHTLKLPWALGAAFFLTHLLDGDPASNTLSWRWVAGLHTLGKTYLARPDNIRTYTNQRFAVKETLATSPQVLETTALPAPRALSELPKPPRHAAIGLLIQEDDLDALNWIPQHLETQSIAGLFPRKTYQIHAIDPKVANFRHACLQHALGTNLPCFDSVKAAVNWAKVHSLDAVVMADIPVGLWNTPLRELSDALKQLRIELYFMRHWWDATLHPQATSGFFKFKQAIPKVLSQFA